MTSQERRLIVANMSGEKMLSLYAAAINGTLASSIPQLIDNENELRYYEHKLLVMKQQAEEYKRQGIDIIWEIPNV